MARRNSTVIWQHLQTFIWLRWRLRSNKNKRAGTASVVIQRVLLAVAAGIAVGALIAGIVAGAFALPAVSPFAFMVVWDVVIVAFLFVWMAELMAELQRSELLSLEKFLHLPVSLTGAFLINYLGSIYGIGAIALLPAMIGLSIGLVFSKGPLMLLLFPLVAAFILAITALTYQFRGWLAALMVNQRRRRTFLAFGGLIFMLMFQLPNIVMNLIPQEQLRQAGETDIQVVQRIAAILNKVIPLGWLPYGAMNLAQGSAVPALLGTLGLALVGAASLKRSYRTTLRLYTGDFTATKPRKMAPVSTTKPARTSATLLERQLPWISEHAAAIALASFRSLTRAPEVKMIVISPLIMVVFFGSMFYRQRTSPSEFIQPLMAAAALTFILFMLVGLSGNLFGFDRSAFRVFVLASAPRKDILLGKNLSLVPVVIGLMTIALVVLQVIYRMRVDHFLAALLQMVPMYLVFCLMGNLLSMIAPMPMAPGTLKPAKPKAKTILIQMGFVFLFPLALAPTLIPLGIEFLLSWSGTYAWFPAYLALTLVEFGLVLFIYPRILGWQGKMLQSREQRILEVVTAKVE